MKKGINIIVFLVVLFSFANIVKAASGPTINSIENKNDDLIYVHATKGDYNISYYLLGTAISNSIKYETSSTETYLSMPNGTYNVWAVDTNGNYSAPYSITKSEGSCNMDGVSNITGSGSIDMCGIMSNKGLYSNLTEGKTIVTCAPGYYLHTIQTEPVYTTCRLTSLEFTPYSLTKRLCKNTFNYRCVKNAGSTQINASSYLTSLTLSKGSYTSDFNPNYYDYKISPTFKQDTFEYTATVPASASIITVYGKLLDDNAQFVDGYEPRTVYLSYGENVVQVKVKGYVLQQEQISTYTIKIIREAATDSGNTSSKSTINTLSGITLSHGELSPKFNPNTNNYTATVENDVDVLNIGATLSDDKASFVKNYGPRNVHLNEGENNVYIKVKSEAGTVRVYKLVISRKKSDSQETPDPTPTPTPTPEPTPSESKALLKSLSLSEGKLDFDSQIFDYNVTVSYDVNNVIATAETMDASDKVEIVGGEDLQIGANELTITVTSSDGSVTNVYTLYIIKKSQEGTISTNSLLKSLTIANHAINFDPNVNEYNITISKNENYVDITCLPDDVTAQITIEGNSNLTTGSQIKIRVTAESGNYTDYLINVTGYKKKNNIFGTILIVIAVILIVAYAVLRALGYKIYFNLTGIKNFFSNLWNSIFTRK